jgi:hypothetical protein
LVRRICAAFPPLWLLALAAQSGGAADRHPVSVADAITMTRLSDQRYFLGDSSEGRVAQFSPDGKWFTIVLERGDIEHNSTLYSLLLFETDRAFDSPDPIVLITLASFSNHPAIKDPKWLADNETLVFLCEQDEESPQVCALNRRTRQIQKRTQHETPVLSFDVSRDGKVIVFLAEAPPRSDRDQAKSKAMVVTTETPDALPRADCTCRHVDLTEANRVYLKVGNTPENRVSFADFVFSYQSISLSPDGQYAVMPAAVTDVPEEWRGYKDRLVQEYVREKRSPGRYSFLGRYLLLDTTTGKIQPLINAPLASPTQGFAWAEDSRSVVVSGTFLPLGSEDPKERRVREEKSFVVEVDAGSGNLTKITDRKLQLTRWLYRADQILLQQPFGVAAPPVAFRKKSGQWKEVAAASSDMQNDAPVAVTLDEDLNTPPDLYVSEGTNHRQKLLLALNPQFANVEFGSAESVSWKATDGHEVSGILYLPPHYQPGAKYPLVIQTHGLNIRRFEIDGPWHSAFAARMLAGRNIVVLQPGHAKDPSDDLKVFNSPEEAPREMAAYEGAIDYLYGRGLIDRGRVGIIGFSRTVWKVEFALTHSKYSFAAATLADGFDAGYWQYLLYPGADTDFARVNGGPPFGRSFSEWLSRSPSFHLDQVQAAVRIEAYGFYSALGSWEWFSGLTHLEKPVELVYLPGAPHLLVRPWDRLASQQGNVDWFCFWLKREEDPDPAKSKQYERWRAMRDLQHQEASSRPSSEGARPKASAP